MDKIILSKAKQIASRIHSKYKEDSKPPTGNQNCQLCTWCAEAQFRGLDVLPRPIYSPRDPALSSEIKGPTIVKDPIKIKIRNKDHIVSTVKANPGSRYYTHVKWNGGTGGHEFLIINIDSNVYIMDAQQGIVESIDKTTYFDDVDYSGSYLARLDDKQLNRELLNKMNSAKTLVPWDWDKDVAYMKKHGMLGEDEEIITQDGIGFRAAKTEDTDQLLEWSLATIPKEQRDKDKIIDMERNDIKDNLKYVKVIVDNVTGKDIGMYEAYPTKWNVGRPVKNGDWFYLDKIFIVAEYRGRKIGSTIIKNAIDMHDKLFLGVDKDNTRAKKLYERFGFRVIEEYPYSYVMALDKTDTTDFRFVRIYVPSDKATEYLKKDPELKQYWEQLNRDTNGEILVDPNTKEQIGHGFVYNGNHKSNEGFIFNIQVMPKYRRQGFGSIILNDCVTKFGGRDLTVDCDNEPAIHMYLKYGFEIIDKGKYSDHGEGYYMRLKKSKAVQEGFIDTSTVCYNLANELRKFKYGLIRNGRLDTNPPDEDYDRYWKLATPEEFENAGGGICYDFVEWEADYLRKHGIICDRFLLAQAHGSNCNSTHSFIVVQDGTKYIYVEGSFENVAKKIDGYKEFDSLQAVFEYVAHEVKACEPDAKTMRYVIFMYSDAVPKAGSDINQFQKYVVDNGTELFEGIIPVEPSDEKSVQEAFIDDRTRPLVPVTDVDFDTVYYGDAIDAGKTRVLDGKPLFVSPLKGIASIFSDRRGRIREEMSKRGYHNYDMGYIEWSLPLDQLQKPLKEVHVYIKRYPDLEPFEFEGEGYIHAIDISKLKDKMCRFDWMDPDREILIAGVDSVDIKKVEKAKVKYYVAGVNHYDKSLVQEGAVMITQESFVQEDIDIGALASAGLAAWKGSKQLKAESMDISMFKRLPMTRENLEKYSSGHGTFIQDLENYRLTQLDDGVILIDEHDIVAGLVIVRRTDNGEVWITRLARSLEWKNDGIILQLAKLAVDEFDAEFAAIDQNNTYVSKLLLNHGWKLLEQDSGMCLMKYVGGEEDEASEYTATDEDKNTFDEIMSEYMLEWGSSGKLFYHLSTQRSLDGQVFKPRVPAYIEPYNPHETGFENSTTPRVCFSSTIEGALNAITVNVQRTNPVTFRDMYVYIPEKPINEYKHKTNKELIRDHDVYDANVTKEMWILEPVRLKLYGVIHVDQARSVKRKPTVKTVDGQRDTRNYFTYKWHWLVKPKVLDSNPFHYDTMAVCRRLADEVNHFKYGLVKNGKLDTNPKNDEWDKYWHLQSPEQFEQSGGGNCWDFVEWEAGYLDAYGIPCKKYYMSTINQDEKLETHTFIVVPNDGKYIYIEAAFKRIADEIHNIKEFDSLHAIFKYVAECMFEHNNCSVLNYGIFDYTDNSPKPGTDSQQYMNWITSKCKVVYEGSIDRKTKKRSESK